MLRPAPAALLLPLCCHAAEGASLSLSSATKKLVQGDSRIGRMLRGQPENADVSVSRNMLSGTTAVGHLALLEKCYMTDDCAPGLFMEADFRTQCETTPFFGADPVCCKPFATPCDSNEACCSGNCSRERARCDDIVPYIPSDDQRREWNNDIGGGQFDDDQRGVGRRGDGTHNHGRYDDRQYDDVRFDDGLYDDRQYDDDQYNDGQYNDGQHDDGQYDDRQYNDGGVIVDDTAADPVLTSPAPVTDPISDPRRPNPADPRKDGGEDDDFGPPVKIDPDGPYAHGRRYSNYDDDYYHGYSRGGAEEETPEPMKLPPQNQHEEENGESTPQAPPPPPDGDHPPQTLPADEDDALPSCVPNYSLGTIETVASSSEERVEVVTMDSQGNIFYTLSFGHGAADTIRRVAPSSNLSLDDVTGGPQHGEDVPVYTGTGVILAMAVDADDNLIFSMGDAPAVSGGVYMLRMAPGGVLSFQDEDGELGGGGEASLDGAIAPAVLLSGGLGPFLPGIAVCPVSADIYVSRGHTGIARLVKDADGGFSTKVEWGMKDMTFDYAGTTQAPLMVWDIAVNSDGIAYLTTYVQGVVLKAIFPRSGGSAQVRLVAGSWNSGVTASSGDGGKAISAVIAYPKGIAIDADDVIYVTEFQGQKIRMVSTTGIMSTVAGTGSTVYEGDGGPASQAGLDLPNALAFAPGKSGSEMAVADFGHSAVRVITPISPCT